MLVVISPVRRETENAYANIDDNDNENNAECTRTAGDLDNEVLPFLSLC